MSNVLTIFVTIGNKDTIKTIIKTIKSTCCIILKQSQYCGEKNLKKTKASHFIYLFHMNVNRLDKPNSLDWEGA